MIGRIARYCDKERGSETREPVTKAVMETDVLIIDLPGFEGARTIYPGVCHVTGLRMVQSYQGMRVRRPESVNRTLDEEEKTHIVNVLRTLRNKIAGHSCTNGFWDIVDAPAKTLLMVSELSEATEMLREKDSLTPDKNCPQHSNLAVEFADTVVRILDMDAAFGLGVVEALVDKVNFNASRPFRHGGKRF